MTTPEEYAALEARVQSALAGGMTLDEVRILVADLTHLYTEQKLVVSERHKLSFEAAQAERLLTLLMSKEQESN